MDIKIKESQYKNMKSVVMENSRLKITIIPESGSKIQSIYDKCLKKEYLIQNPAKTFIKSDYGSYFGDGDVSGFDEIFPSIESCYYPSWPWKGNVVPDHGEVWALPWEYEMENDTIKMSVHGVRFPYIMEKGIVFDQENSLKISYKVRNCSDFDFYFSWAPHILFDCEKDTTIVLPKSVSQIISTCSVENKLGGFGSIHSWPTTKIKGDIYDISKIYPKYAGKCEKYYAMGQVKEGCCSLDSNKNTITLSYPVEQVPYLGVWEGILNNNYVVALEPCTGDLDFLDTAFQWKRVSILHGNSEYKWHLILTFIDKEKEETSGLPIN
ncbi:MAG: hypothetical protein ACERKN_00210 [Velocimicrobium sp.]